MAQQDGCARNRQARQRELRAVPAGAEPAEPEAERHGVADHASGWISTPGLSSRMVLAMGAWPDGLATQLAALASGDLDFAPGGRRCRRGKLFSIPVGAEGCGKPQESAAIAQASWWSLRHVGQDQCHRDHTRTKIRHPPPMTMAADGLGDVLTPATNWQQPCWQGITLQAALSSPSPRGVSAGAAMLTERLSSSRKRLRAVRLPSSRLSTC